MQITQGSVTLTGGSTKVVSTQDQVTDDWSEVVAGDVFVVFKNPTPYFVAAVTSSAVSTSGFWEITLSAAYVGDDVVGSGYTIVSDFTAHYNIPLMQRGDAESALIFSLAMARIDALVFAGGGAIGKLLDLLDFPFHDNAARAAAAGKQFRVKGDGTGFEFFTPDDPTLPFIPLLQKITISSPYLDGGTGHGIFPTKMKAGKRYAVTVDTGGFYTIPMGVKFAAYVQGDYTDLVKFSLDENFYPTPGDSDLIPNGTVRFFVEFDSSLGDTDGLMSFTIITMELFGMGWSGADPNFSLVETSITYAAGALTTGGSGFHPEWAYLPDFVAEIGLVNGLNYVIPVITDSAVTNGTNLLDAIIRANGLTPNGVALANLNRSAIRILPGVYDLGTASIVLDVPYVDFLGITGDPKDVIIISHTTDPSTGAIMHLSNGTVRGVTALVVATSDLRTSIDSTDPCSYFRNSGGGIGNVEDCIFMGGNVWSMRIGIDYQGYFKNVTADVGGFGGPLGTFSGLAENCKAGTKSFGYRGTCSGTLKYCDVTDICLSGNFTGSAFYCIAELGSFGGSSPGAGGVGTYTGTMTGHLHHCTLTGVPGPNGPFTVSGGGTVALTTDYLSPTNTPYRTPVIPSSLPLFRTVVAANHNAVKGDNLVLDTSGGAFTVTMMPTPVAGDTIDALPATTWTVNHVTIDGNGYNIEGSSTAVLDTDVLVTIRFNGTEYKING